jgi:hypothetical protein
MIRVRIKIGDNEIKDTYDAYGFIYQLESDNVLGAEMNDTEETTYAEQDGSNEYPYTTFKAFDYKVSFVISAPNKDLENANAKVDAFNKLLYDNTGTGDLKKLKTITFYNDYKHVKVVGTGRNINKATDFYRDKNGKIHDAITVDFTIHVSNPNLCDFAYVKED